MHRKRQVAALGAVILSAGMLSALPVAVAGAASVSDQWAGNGASGGQSQDNAGESALIAGGLGGLHQAWSQVAQSSTYGATAVLSGVAYTEESIDTASQHPTVLARDAVTGAIKWSVSTPTQDSVAARFGPTDTGTRLLVPVQSTSQHAGLLALDPASGKLLWEQHLPSAAAGVAVDNVYGFAVSDNTAYVLDDGGVLQAFNATTGSLLWTLNTLTLARYGAQTDIAAEDGSLFLDAGGTLYALAAATGKSQWTADASATINSTGQSTVSAGGGRVYVSGDAVQAFPETGCGKTVCAALWTSRAGNMTGTNAGWLRVGAVTATTVAVQASLAQGGVNLVLLNAATGATQWTAALSSFDSLPIQAGNLIWIADGSGVSAYPVTCATTCHAIAAVSDTAVGSGAALSIADGSLFVQTWPTELDVFRANPAAAATTLADDDFARTVTNGFGTASPTGGVWTSTGTESDLSIAPSAADITLAAGGGAGAYLKAVSRSSVDILTSVTAPNAIVGGNGYYLYFLVRRVSATEAYLVRLRIRTNYPSELSISKYDGSATETSLTTETPVAQLPPEASIHIRLESTGTFPTTLRAKAWTGTTEPTAWTLTTTDSSTALQAPGAVGLQGYLSRSVTTSPTNVLLTSWDVAAVQ